MNKQKFITDLKELKATQHDGFGLGRLVNLVGWSVDGTTGVVKMSRCKILATPKRLAKYCPSGTDEEISVFLCEMIPVINNDIDHDVDGHHYELVDGEGNIISLNDAIKICKAEIKRASYE